MQNFNEKQNFMMNELYGAIRDKNWEKVSSLIVLNLEIIIDALGFDPIWFGVMFTVMMLISYMSPPFAYAAFFVKGAVKNPDEMPLDQLYYATFPFLAVYFLGVLLLCLFPQFIMYLPNLMYS
ncbi:MAG: TRAP transporter large permease subunit [Candidatus Heteroscillospira sp.]|jgi:TRAP-type mannitol/chloroaromatic compound transport system permease large subunit